MMDRCGEMRAPLKANACMQYQSKDRPWNWGSRSAARAPGGLPDGAAGAVTEHGRAPAGLLAILDTERERGIFVSRVCGVSRGKTHT
jgi:hypothetical protein